MKPYLIEIAFACYFIAMGFACGYMHRETCPRTGERCACERCECPDGCPGVCEKPCCEVAWSGAFDPLRSMTDMANAWGPVTIMADSELLATKGENGVIVTVEARNADGKFRVLHSSAKPNIFEAVKELDGKCFKNPNKGT